MITHISKQIIQMAKKLMLKRGLAQKKKALLAARRIGNASTTVSVTTLPTISMAGTAVQTRTGSPHSAQVICAHTVRLHDLKTVSLYS
jgi:hypothetical protein